MDAIPLLGIIDNSNLNHVLIIQITGICVTVAVFYHLYNQIEALRAGFRAEFHRLRRSLEDAAERLLAAINHDADVHRDNINDAGQNQRRALDERGQIMQMVLIEMANAQRGNSDFATETAITTLLSAGYSITCVFDVKNSTALLLDDGRMCATWGVVVVAPSFARPNGVNMVATRKTNSTVTGSSGCFSYKLMANPPRRIIIKWEAPYNFNHHANLLAVGISTVNVDDHLKNWYDEMKDPGRHAVNDNFGYDLHYYDPDMVRMVSYDDGAFTVRGMMSSAHEATVTVYVEENVQHQIYVRR